MKNRTCSLDHLIDQVNISETEREATKAQIHRAEAVVDFIVSCGRTVNRLVKSLTHRQFKGARQH